MYVIMEQRLLYRNFLRLKSRSNTTSTCFSFWNQLIKFCVTCRCFLIPELSSKIVVTLFDLGNISFLFSYLTLSKGTSNKILKTNFEMKRYNFLHHDNVIISFPNSGVCEKILK